MTKQYYAGYNPRGFQNEIEVHSFATQEARDMWVEENDLDDAHRGAWKMSAESARKTLAENGDDATEMFHSLVEHP